MRELEGRRIALIGGAGFIGHNLALQLKERGAEPFVIDSLMVNNWVSLAGDRKSPFRDLYTSFINERLELLRDARIELDVVDARDYHALSRHLSMIEAQTVVHLAAVAHANRANKTPYTTFDHTVRTLENALDWSRDRAEHFVFFSSSMVYGNFEAESVTEDAHCDPVGIYGAVKFGGEKLVKAYSQVFDLPYSIVRPSALYGERCISRRVAQVFVENVLRGETLRVTGDPEERLDFTYIRDLVDGLIRVIENPAAEGEVFNLTYGESRSIRQLIDILQEEFDDLTVEYDPPDRLMPSRGTLAVDKAREMLGYEPRFPLEMGIPAYVDWYRKRFAEDAEVFTPR